MSDEEQILDLQIALYREEYLRINASYDSLYGKISYIMAFDGAYFSFVFDKFFNGDKNNLFCNILGIIGLFSLGFCFLLLFFNSFGKDLPAYDPSDVEISQWQTAIEVKRKIRDDYKKIVNGISKFLNDKQEMFEGSLKLLGFGVLMTILMFL